MRKKYSKQELVLTLQAFHKAHGKIPSGPDTTKTKELPHYKVFENYFGSWNNALREAGLPVYAAKNSKTEITDCCNCKCSFVLPTKRYKYAVSRNKNLFCSKNCAAAFNNKNKKHGCRRSKLEIFIEERLRLDFPDILFIFNSGEAIGFELDIYMPQLRLAIEINGIVHYEPIYGVEKFQRIQKNDKQKMLLCYDHGIELIVINTKQHNRVNKITCESYYQEIKNILNSVSSRVIASEMIP